MAAPDTWQAPASGGTVADAAVGFHTVSYAGGYWFSVTNVSGSNLRVRYATNPTGAWTEITMPTAPVGTTSYNFDYNSGVISDGSTWAFLAIYSVSGTHTPRVIYTSDPAGSWSSYDPSVGTAVVESMAYGNGVWAIVGRTASGTPYSPRIATATSANGTYTAYTSAADTGYDTGVLGSFRIMAIRYDGTANWVTAGLTSTGVEYARTGTSMSPPGSWTAPSSYTATGALDANRLRYQSGHWTVLDNQGRLVVWASDPAGSWSVEDDTTHGLDSYTAEIAHVRGYWVLVGATGFSPYTPALAYTTSTAPDGNWITAQAGSGLAGFTSPAADTRLMGIATDGTYLVAGSQYYGELRWCNMSTPRGPRRRAIGTSYHLRQRQTPYLR